MILELIDMMH